MVNATEFRSRCAVLLLAALVLTAAAWLRGAEYDEQYTLFLTAGTPRPNWPQSVFPAGMVATVQGGHATLAGIVRDLRATDVHPPLYFWAVSLWRFVFGPSLFAIRMLSVLCGLVSLSLVGVIARRCTIQPAVAMLLTLGCYGFVYTNAIARGFAPAQMLTLCGVALLLRRRPLLAGACLGAACCCNYLAVFVAVAAVVAGGEWLAVGTAVPFLALDAWFFAAQHAARPGQFPPFEVWPSLHRLAEYQTASVFGGLPLYVDGIGRAAVAAGVGLLAVGLLLRVALSRPLNAGPAIRMLLAAAIATPMGLLLLGAVFDNTPIELRYLSFGLPFIGLLIAWAYPKDGRQNGPPRCCLPAVMDRLVRATDRGAVRVEVARTSPTTCTHLVFSRRLRGWSGVATSSDGPAPGCAREKASFFNTEEERGPRRATEKNAGTNAMVSVTNTAMSLEQGIQIQFSGGFEALPHEGASREAPCLFLRGPSWSSFFLRVKKLACHRSNAPLLEPWHQDLRCVNPVETRRAMTRNRQLLRLLLTVQLASIIGLLLAPRTMQPARIAATDAARLAGDGIVLLPRGNDGVGIVGAFGIEAPPSLKLLLVRPTDPIAGRVAPYRRVVLALLGQDRDSIAAIPVLRAAFAPPNWRLVATQSNVEVYERTGKGE